MLQPKRQEQEQPVELDKTVDFDAIARKLLASKPSVFRQCLRKT